MSDMAEYAYHQSAKLVQGASAALIALLKAWAELVENHLSYAPYKKLAQWIKNGGECKVYQVQAPKGEQDRVIARMLQLAEEKQLGALKISDSGLIIVPDAQINDIQQLNREVLIQLGNYYQEVPIAEMEAAMQRLPESYDKNIVTINGLTEQEAEVIKNKTNNITKGFMVGTDCNERKEHTVGVMASRAFNGETGKHDFCKAMLSAMVSLYGVNHEEKLKRLERDKKSDAQIFAAADAPENHYVAGSDGVTYLEISDKGYTKYKAQQREDGRLISTFQAHVDRTDINFFSELQREVDTIFDEKMFDSIEDLTAHLGTKRKTTKEEFQYRENSKVQRRIVDVMDVMAKERIKASIGEEEISTQQAINRYIREVRKITAGLCEGKVPEGYTADKMNDLWNVSLYDNKTQYDLTALRASIERMYALSIEVRVANKEKQDKNREKDAYEKE